MAKAQPKLLVVDDEPVNLRLMRAILEPEGYEVVTAESGYACLDRLKEQSFDLVVLDVMMPGIDGVETCRQLKQMPENADLPVVFVTALTDRDSRIRAKEVGADDFLGKPVDEMELLTRAANLVKVKAYHDLQRDQKELLEKELEARTRELLRAERLSTLGGLATGVAHELGNVVSALNGTIAVLDLRTSRREIADPKILGNLRTVAKHLTDHVRHLRRLGQPGPEQDERIDLSAAAEATLHLLGTTGRLRQAKVNLVAPEDPIWVLMNGTRLEQILINLVLNAADALGDTGRADGTISVTLEAGDGLRIPCKIVDNGGGIPDDVKDKIFEAYFTTKAPGKGTGLGLSVVRRIIESYGGTIELKSGAGQGTTVSFDLPGTQPPR